MSKIAGIIFVLCLVNIAFAGKLGDFFKSSNFGTNLRESQKAEIIAAEKFLQAAREGSDPAQLNGLREQLSTILKQNVKQPEPNTLIHRMGKELDENPVDFFAKYLPN